MLVQRARARGRDLCVAQVGGSGAVRSPKTRAAREELARRGLCETKTSAAKREAEYNTGVLRYADQIGRRWK